MKLLLPFTLSLLIQFNCSAQHSPDSNYVYSLEDTIQGQIETAIRLKYCMDSELYDIAIILFSEAQQKKIIEFFAIIIDRVFHPILFITITNFVHILQEKF